MATDPFPARFVLEGVPEIGYHVRLCPFPGSAESLLGFLEDPQDYAWIMGITGACFRRVWSRDDGGNVDLMYFAPEPYARLFGALGYGFRTAPPDDKQAILALVREGLESGVPVLSCGPVGPPEVGIVTGWEDGGETLLGWSYFQSRETPGYYRQPGWFEGRDPNGAFGALLLTTPHADRADARETLISSLKWAVELALASDRLPGYVCGVAAYEAWAGGLEVDADFPAGDDGALSVRAMIHGDQCVMLAEREQAASYLRQAAAQAMEVAVLLEAAADAYAAARETLSRIWLWGMPDEPATRAGLRDRATRTAIAAAIREAGGHEAEAVRQLREALRTLDPDWRAPGEEGSSWSPLPASCALALSERTSYRPEDRRAPEQAPLAGTLRAVLDFLGRGLGLAALDSEWHYDRGHMLLMAASGLAFSHVWFPIDPEARLLDPDYAFPDPARPFVDAGRAVGLRLHALIRPAAPTADTPGPGMDPPTLRRFAVHAIARDRRPLILTGLPEWPHWTVVTGYEDTGAVLTGWSCEPGGPGILFAPEKAVRVTEWEPRTLASITVREVVEAPALAESAPWILTRACELLRERERGGFVAGEASLEEWARRLETTDPARARDSALVSPPIWEHAERRWYGSLYLGALAEALPAAAAPLSEASQRFVAEHDLMWELSRTCGEDLSGLAEAEVRARVAGMVRRCRELDLQVAELLDAARAHPVTACSRGSTTQRRVASEPRRQPTPPITKITV